MVWWNLRVCRLRIGLLPNATLQTLDDRWLQELSVARQGLDVALDRVLARHVTAGGTSTPPAGWSWRNTLGARIVEVSMPSFGDYFALQADLELRRQALVLALSAQALKMPTAERAAWLDRQDLPPRLRTRLSWSADAGSMNVRPWLAEIRPQHPLAASYGISTGR